MGAKLDIDHTSFSHGQIISKVWLCDNIEKYLKNDTKILILGAWYNVLGFMLLTRYKQITKITGVDINKDVKFIADRICDAWPSIVNNITMDADLFDSSDYDIIINCSPEHMKTNDWFFNISKNKLVIIQSSNVTIEEEPWLVSNPNPTIDRFITKYKCNNTHFIDTLSIDYTHWGYKRFMLIGEK